MMSTVEAGITRPGDAAFMGHPRACSTSPSPKRGSGFPTKSAAAALTMYKASSVVIPKARIEWHDK